MRTLLLALGLAAAAQPAHAAEPLQVVATFSILGDMTEVIGGERVAVTTLVGAGGDLHVFNPTPRQAATVAKADAIVMNGLSLEGWMERLVAASGYRGPVIVASRDVAPLRTGDTGSEAAHRQADADHVDANHADTDHTGHHHHGVYDPHAWQDLSNAVLYVHAIADGLAAADPDGAETYAANAAAYAEAIAALDAEAKAEMATIPLDARTILTNHDAFAYFGEAYGVTFVSPQGVSTEAEPSARDVAALVTQIRDAGIDAVFLENVADNRLVEQIAVETGVTLGGELYADALSPAGGDGATYLDMMRHNLGVLVKALGKGA
ncbi:metal ABC transporter solute-binding protein, Zn/Mn family [Acuticoccus sp. I52.16.1]|uniref:metal ABC transporter solute-binding protein, Zn/Mn family n=1 Tax=Acuticoccus sp. I52.16.1 TaxID=2928472 RepID=UPI001FCFD7C2|nr:zinc ABC transporter substrate-binding protein [Acuticoccus sp. I52.16.1]UOM33235.1 zinc ABC transporter substrate-binding protein [Acuticoccus sp. I52.16.1]